MVSQKRAVARALRQWRERDQGLVLATVVSTTDSAPRGVGAQLAVTGGDVWMGGLSGGCAEVAVLEQARRLLDGRAGDAAVFTTMTRDELGAAGPVCGATLGVLVERVDDALLDHLEQALDSLTRGHVVRAHRTYVAGEDGALRRDRLAVDELPVGGSGNGAAPRRRSSLAWQLEEATAEPAHPARASFEELVPPAPQLVVGGAGDIATECLTLARQLGWRTALVDPRGAFVEQTLAQVQPDVVVREWPPGAFASLQLDATSACVAAAHDEKLDLPFLTGALASSAFYVGSVGSRVVQHERRAQLIEHAGDAAAAAHHGPAGLDLGGSGAAEIALSILGEMVATWNGRTGTPLRDSREPIRAR